MSAPRVLRSAPPNLRWLSAKRARLYALLDKLVASDVTVATFHAVDNAGNDFTGSVSFAGANLVDVTVLDVLDSFACRTLSGIAHMTRLRGAETVIVGIQPDVAFAMVQLGLTLSSVATALDLEEGLAYLDARAARNAQRSERRGR